MALPCAGSTVRRCGERLASAAPRAHSPRLERSRTAPPRNSPSQCLRRRLWPARSHTAPTRWGRWGPRVSARSGRAHPPRSCRWCASSGMSSKIRSGRCASGRPVAPPRCAARQGGSRIGAAQVSESVRPEVRGGAPSPRARRCKPPATSSRRSVGSAAVAMQVTARRRMNRTRRSSSSSGARVSWQVPSGCGLSKGVDQALAVARLREPLRGPARSGAIAPAAAPVRRGRCHEYPPTHPPRSHRRGPTRPWPRRPRPPASHGGDRPPARADARLPVPGRP